MKKILSLSLLLALSVPLHAQEAAHIADDVYVFTHGGPGNQYRINGRVNSGEPVTILGRQNQYIQIRTESGRTSWVPAEFVATGKSKLAQLPSLEESLITSETRIEEQDEEIARLNQQISSISGNNSKFTEQINHLERQIVQLESEIANMDQSNLIRWLTHGGLVALGGVLLGLFVPYLPKRRKRRDDWF